MDLSAIKHFSKSEDLVKILCNKTQNPDRGFFRLSVAYNFSKIASMMRCSVKMPGRGNIPVNCYCINLAPSGQGKGHSTAIIEDQVINQFRDYFVDAVFDEIAKSNISLLAARRAHRKGTDPDTEQERAEAEFTNAGEIMFSFDEATVPAVKQQRRKLQLANAGALSFECDEIAQNLIRSTDVLAAFLELYDVGKIKEKLVKNTQENQRGYMLTGNTPANMMLYGTPTKLLDGGSNERLYLGFLDMGYARRSFFGYIPTTSGGMRMSVQERMQAASASNSDKQLEDLSDELLLLADPIHFNRELTISDPVLEKLFEYQVYCELRSDSIPEHDEIRKAEMFHRYFKVLKLAGAYAFIDVSHEIKEEHLYGAIALAEESGNALENMLRRERDYVRLAKYISSSDRQVTHVDIAEDLAFYPANSQGRRNEMINMAMSWGHKNSVVIRRHYLDSIELFSGSKLEEVNLSKMILSHGIGVADGYQNEFAPWDKIHKLTQQPNYNFVNHQLTGSHRDESEIAAGFDMVVLDIDDGISIDTVQLLLADYKYHIYTTKSHDDKHNHFRILMPMTHRLKLNKEEYAQFMENIYNWLPFTVDTATKDRSRKWATHKGQYWYNEGQQLDPQLFIPRTRKNDELMESTKTLRDLNNIERWFVTNTGEGNRSNNLIRYAFMLVDAGLDFIDIQTKITELNEKLSEPLSTMEINGTILRSAMQRLSKRNTNV